MTVGLRAKIVISSPISRDWSEIQTHPVRMVEQVHVHWVTKRSRYEETAAALWATRSFNFFVYSRTSPGRRRRASSPADAAKSVELFTAELLTAG